MNSSPCSLGIIDCTVVSDTTQLALLIDERDEILENLEIAETKYIQSFRLSTPDPSIADYQPALPPISEDPAKPEISRPRPLAGSTVSDAQFSLGKMSSNESSVRTGVEDAEVAIRHLARRPSLRHHM